MNDYKNITDNQCLWQLIPLNEESNNFIIFQYEYIVLKPELNTLLGTKIETESFIYSLNFSMN